MMKLTKAELKRIEQLRYKIILLHDYLEKRHEGDDYLLNNVIGASMCLQDAVTEHDIYHGEKHE